MSILGLLQSSAQDPKRKRAASIRLSAAEARHDKKQVPAWAINSSTAPRSSAHAASPLPPPESKQRLLSAFGPRCSPSIEWVDVTGCQPPLHTSRLAPTGYATLQKGDIIVVVTALDAPPGLAAAAPQQHVSAPSGPDLGSEVSEPVSNNSGDGDDDEVDAAEPVNLQQFSAGMVLELDSLPSGTAKQHIKLLKRLGGGGFGLVFQAEMSPFGTVALKLDRFAHQSAPSHHHHHHHHHARQLQDPLLQEAEHMHSLGDSPHVTKCFASGFVPMYNSSFLVMEMGTCSVHALYSGLDSGGLPECTVKDVTRHMLRGLVSVHRAGLVHRDLKCENLLVFECPGGVVVKIGDFGLAVKAEAAVRQRAGSKWWMAPEVEQGDVCTTAADIWSVGATFIEAYTGEMPFSYIDALPGSEADKTIKRHMAAEQLDSPACEYSRVFSAEQKAFLKLCFEPASTRPSAAELLQHTYLAI